MNNNSEVTQQANMIIGEEKNMVGAVLLTFIFGPFGMLYSTIVGGVVMLVLSIIIAAETLGFGLIITQIICLAWTIIVVDKHNRRVWREHDITI